MSEAFHQLPFFPHAGRSKKRVIRLVIGLAFAPSVLGCGGGDASERLAAEARPAPATAAQDPQPLFSTAGHGHFLGEATIDGVTYFSESLVTVDGAVRLHVGGPWADPGAGLGPSDEVFDPEESTLFVGTIDAIDGDRASGSGVIIGQVCHEPIPRPYCEEPAPARINVTVAPEGEYWRLEGELQIEGNSGEERWMLSLGEWSNYYKRGAHPVPPDGSVYVEQLAPFAQAEDVDIEVDATGRVTFRSATSGCTGNGTLAPHLDGRFDVYDVWLRIDGCAGGFAYLNADFEGLATHTQSGAWDYDYWILVFLAAAEGPPPRPALTMRAHAS
jgi:hypothetical protein